MTTREGHTPPEDRGLYLTNFGGITIRGDRSREAQAAIYEQAARETGFQIQVIKSPAPYLGDGTDWESEYRPQNNPHAWCIYSPAGRRDHSPFWAAVKRLEARAALQGVEQ